MKRIWLAFLLLLVPSLSNSAPPLEDADVAKLHTLIRPQKGEEKWQEIPWLANLWDARQKAAEEGKPILLWEMDGHPLGCV